MAQTEWILQPPPGAQLILWTDGTVRLRFDSTKGQEMLDWLQHCMNSCSQMHAMQIARDREIRAQQPTIEDQFMDLGIDRKVKPQIPTRAVPGRPMAVDPTPAPMDAPTHRQRPGETAPLDTPTRRTEVVEEAPMDQPKPVGLPRITDDSQLPPQLGGSRPVQLGYIGKKRVPATEALDAEGVPVEVSDTEPPAAG